jgi:hypothetical protein
MPSLRHVLSCAIMCQAARRIGVNGDVNAMEVTLQHSGEQNVARVLEADH